MRGRHAVRGGGWRALPHRGPVAAASVRVKGAVAERAHPAPRGGQLSASAAQRAAFGAAVGVSQFSRCNAAGLQPCIGPVLRAFGRRRTTGRRPMWKNTPYAATRSFQVVAEQ
ncbi:uncharacterized protein Tco025E_10129 [Trypanosoma conorhini]|uniref:Uncharacterized protein n=1 Tax=Trypanosoma conorhini TaxID=83891 RepID=A0A3R7KIL4_9TRYP|nr:uncharacterized protein Tco025E_10129 [Trypanosoma conorhini]RNE95189.1 hypothetical protein Tco025E_10129 [Trypanosoma conorhini]